jgi:microcompartment protein CcmL/EutN
MADALALVEVDSVALGLRALDALVKRAPVAVLEANLVEPGRFLLLYEGGVAEVEEAHRAALEVADGLVVDALLLPQVHPGVLAGLRGVEHRGSAEALDTLGVVEGARVAATLDACDRALKDAAVTLGGLRVAGGLGGRAFFLVHGAQHDVEAALEAGGARLSAHGALHRVECIPRPHEDMVAWLLRPAPFTVGPRAR